MRREQRIGDKSQMKDKGRQRKTKQMTSLIKNIKFCFIVLCHSVFFHQNIFNVKNKPSKFQTNDHYIETNTGQK